MTTPDEITLMLADDPQFLARTGRRRLLASSGDIEVVAEFNPADTLAAPRAVERLTEGLVEFVRDVAAARAASADG